MPLITQALPGFFNGISQQSPLMRLGTQCSLQENALGDLVKGLEKRPPTEHLTILESSNIDSCFAHKIIEETGEAYLVFFTGDDTNPIEVYDTTGLPCAVSYGNLTEDLVFTEDSTVKDYAKASHPALRFRALTINDYTFIVKNSRTAWMTNDVTGGSVDDTVQSFTDLPETPSNNDIAKVTGDDTNDFDDFYVQYDGDVWVQCPKPGITYKFRPETMPHKLVKIASSLPTTNTLAADYIDDHFEEGSYATKTTPASGGYDDDGACTKLDADHAVITYSMAVGWDGDGEEIEVTAGAVMSFSFWAKAGQADTYMYYSVFDRDKVQYALIEEAEEQLVPEEWTQFSLPFTVPVGCEYISLHIYCIPTSAADYVLFDDAELGSAGGSAFVFSDIDWGEREVGDDTSCPKPSFYGKKINNVFFYKDRLGLLSESNAIMSRAGSYFNFWNESAIDIFDDDPIDVSAAIKQVENLRSTAVFDKSLLVLSDGHQFDLGSGDTALSPTTVTLTPTTNFEILDNSEPVSAGANVYFPCPNGDYISVREYFIQPDSLVDDAANITAHVPNYVPTGNVRMDVCGALDTMFFHSDEDAKNLYVYKYYWSGDEKPQSAWSKWTFAEDILAHKVIGTTLYIVQEYAANASWAAGVALRKLELGEETAGDLTFQIHLDNRYECTGVGSLGSNVYTYFRIPYVQPADQDFVVVRADTGQPISGITRNGSVSGVDNSGEYIVTGDYDGIDVFFGWDYTMKYRLSPWYIKDRDGNATVAGRLQTRTFTVAYRDTGYFRIEVTAKERDIMTHTYSGVTIGVSTIGDVPLDSGEFRALIMGQAEKTNIEIINDTYLPSLFENGFLEGFYHKRSR